MARQRKISDDLGSEPVEGEVTPTFNKPEVTNDAPPPEPQEQAGEQASSESTPTEPAPAEGGSFLDYLANRNLPTESFKGLDDEAILGQLADGYAASHRQQAELQRQQQEAEYYRYQLLQAQAARPQQPAPQPQQQQAKAKWNPPEYDPAWLKLLKQDENGNIVPIAGAAPDLVQKVTAYRDWLERQQQEFYRNPSEFIWQTSDIEDRIANSVNQIVEQRMTAARNQQAAELAWQQNASWMTARDQTTGQPIIGQNGMPQLTPEGQVALMETRRQMELGRPFEEAFRSGYAMAYMQVHQVAEAHRRQEAAKTPAQKQEASNLGFLKRAVTTKKASQTGAAPAANGKPLPARFNTHDPEILKAMLVESAKEAGFLS